MSNCCHKTKERSEEEYKKLMNRLSRIEGQIRGVKRMLEEDAYCIDILTQSSAISSAINAFNRELLNNHLKSCVVHDLKEGNEETMEELLNTLPKLMK